MDSTKINKYEGIAFIVIVMINLILVNMPKSSLSLCANSAWINIIYVSILAIIFILLICKVFEKFPNDDILDISEFVGGKFLKVIMGIAYMLFFGLLFVIIAKYFSEAFRLIYFRGSNSFFLLLLFLFGAIAANKFAPKAMFKLCLILVVFIILNIGLNFSVLTEYFIPERFFPILGNGINETFLLGTSSIFAFMGISHIYFLMPLLQKKEDFKSVAVISTIISTICLLVSLIALLLIFPFISSSEELLSIFLLSRLVQYGKFLQGIEAIIVFSWFLIILSYLGILLHLLLEIFKKIAKTKDRGAMSYCFCSLIFIGTLLIKNITQMKFLQKSILKYFSLILIFGISGIILLIAYFKKKRQKKGNFNTPLKKEDL